jgi:eukaryotic-like serine/threonine-protein kinase
MIANPPQRIGPFEIRNEIGHGAMGVVYRARDTRLERDVAIKMLPDHLAGHPQRLVRFQREAKVLAALNHPNIAAIHGLEEAEGRQYLVLEYVEGEMLATLLEKRALSWREVLPLARQMAEALEAAHEKGIVHRDLKPHNVIVRADGVVKVLDFGLAHVVEPLPAVSQTSSLASDGLLTAGYDPTMPGVVLGTPGYMSPEQVSGKIVDTRSDVFSFGCVLYEMLARQRLFRGQSIADSLDAIQHREPDWSLLPAEVPPGIRLLVKRCLMKDPVHRLQHMGDARIELEDGAKEPSDGGTAEMSDDGGRRAKGRARLRVALVVLATAVLAAVASWNLAWRSVPAGTARLDYHLIIPRAGGVEADPRQRADRGMSWERVLSPDGKHIVYASQGKLWVRSLDRAEPRELRGTEEGHWAFWSPDSRYVAYFTEKELKRVSLTGAAPETLCGVPNCFMNGSWAPDGTILIEMQGDPTVAGLYLLRPGESKLEERFKLHDKGQLPFLWWPRFLPDSRHFLLTGLDLETGEPSILVGTIGTSKTDFLTHGDSRAEYAAPGYILFLKNGRLFAQSFDVRTLTVAGEPRPLVDQVSNYSLLGRASYSVSQEGTLLYGPVAGPVQVQWYDRVGRDLGKVELPKLQAPRCEGFRLSPDGKRLAVAMDEQTTGTADLWIVDFANPGTPVRMTAHAGSEFQPAWSPDGKSLAFSADWNGAANLYVQPDDPDKEPVAMGRLVASPQFVTDWSADGRTILFDSIAIQQGWHLWVVDEQTKDPHPLTNSAFRESNGAFSPDGKWLAYCSTESEQSEVYVRPFGTSGTSKRISSDGGDQPRWRRDGKELFYWDRQNALMAASVDLAGPAASLQKTETLFHLGDVNRIDYDVAPDGQRFLIGVASHESQTPPDHVITGWTRLLDSPGKP